MKARPIAACLLALCPAAVAQKVAWVRTARAADDSAVLLKEMDPFAMIPMPRAPERTLTLDFSTTYQEIVGFGGAFTEAAAINWRSLSRSDQAEVIRLYFDPVERGGHGYTLGRVPINSCDFSPASYNFDDTVGDVDLAHFDDSVGHDVDSGVIPMIQAARDAVAKRADGATLRMFASPWSPPAWMKEAVDGETSMLISARPNGLAETMQRPWAEYFSRRAGFCTLIASAAPLDCIWPR